MHDLRKTGAFISQLRKERDWTQLELADRLSVTHQAVSRWETGMSFPDIATLMQLADLFGVQVDDVLNGERRPPAADPHPATLGDVLTELAHDHPEHVARMVREGRVPIETLIAAGPLALPTTMEQLMSTLENVPFTPRQLRDLAPFLSQETLQRLVERSGGDAPPLELISALAPFLGPELLGRLVQQIADGRLDMRYLRQIAPFLAREEREVLLAAGGGDGRLGQFVQCLAPFLDAEQRDGLVARVIEGTLDPSVAITLGPFLDQDALLRLISADRGAPELFTRLAPFLAQETIARLIAPQGDDSRD